jgi:hypothetical protein
MLFLFTIHPSELGWMVRYLPLTTNAFPAPLAITDQPQFLMSTFTDRLGGKAVHSTTIWALMA